MRTDEDRKRTLASVNKFKTENPELWAKRHKEYMKKYRANNKESLRFAEIKRKYGLTKAQFLELHKSQDGKCAICQETMEMANIDHDHQTGAVRALLCSTCNWGLGQFKDDPALLARACDYLHRFKSNL